MGAQMSQLRAEEVEELHECTNFTRIEIKNLYKRFTSLDKDEKGTINKDDLLAIPQLAMNPLASRVFALFDDSGNEEVNFRQFVITLSSFHPRAKDSLKLKSAFKLFDFDGDGAIDKKDLVQVLQLMVGKTLTDEQLNELAASTISLSAAKNANLITFEEFCDALKHAEIKQSLSVSFPSHEEDDE